MPTRSTARTDALRLPNFFFVFLGDRENHANAKNVLKEKKGPPRTPCFALLTDMAIVTSRI